MIRRKIAIVSNWNHSFCLSDLAFKELGLKTWKEENPEEYQREMEKIEPYDYWTNINYLYPEHGIKRDSPRLIKVLERLGKDAWGSECEIKIVSIPYNVKWRVREENGSEWIEEIHRTWA